MTKFNQATIECLFVTFLDTINKCNYDAFSELIEDFQKHELNLINGLDLDSPSKFNYANVTAVYPLECAIVNHSDGAKTRLKMIEKIIDSGAILNLPKKNIFCGEKNFLYIAANATHNFSYDEIESILKKMISKGAYISKGAIEDLKSYYAGHPNIILIDSEGKQTLGHVNGNRIYSNEQIEHLESILNQGVRPSLVATMVSQSSLYQSAAPEPFSFTSPKPLQ